MQIDPCRVRRGPLAALISPSTVHACALVFAVYVSGHAQTTNSAVNVYEWGNCSGPCDAPADLTNAVDVATGWFHNLAVRADGRVVAWGNDNSYGQINVPPDLTNAAGVAAGFGHSLVLRADGTLAAWGYNSDGQAIVPSA